MATPHYSTWISGWAAPPWSPRQVIAFITTAVLLALAHAVYTWILKPAVFSELSRLPAAHWSAHLSPRWMAQQRDAGRESRTIYAAHARHGPVVRLGPDEVSVMSLEGVRKIYGGVGFERTRWFDAFTNYGAPNLVTLYGRDEHARRRRAVAGLFTKSAIVASGDFQALAAAILWGRLFPVLGGAAAGGVGLDFYGIAFALGAEFMSAYEFGIQNGYDLVSKGREAVRDAYLLDGQRKLRGTEGPVRSKAAAEELEAQCMTMMETTREEMQRVHEEDDDDERRGSHARRTAPLAFANLSDHIFEEEKSLSMRDALKLIASEMLDNIEAAREGIGLALTYAAHELSLDTATQTSLRDELRQAFTSSPMIATQQLDADSLRALDKLPVLDAVVNETLRLRPPAPGPQRRWVPKDGVVIGGYYIPEGTTIHVSPYCLHRAPEAFPDAESWKPGRWLTSSQSREGDTARGDGESVGNLQSYIFAFSSGRRTCLGNHFATVVMKLVLALIYTNFRTDVIDDQGIEQVDDVMGWPSGGKLVLGFTKV